MSIGQRIAEVRGSRSRKAFAEHVGIVENTLRNYETSLSLPNSDVVSEICTKEQISPLWLLTGEGPRSADSIAKAVENKDLGVLDVSTHQIIMIPMVEARLSAGYGSFETDGTSERRYSFRSDFLRRKGNIREMVLMRVDGDSMEPEVRNGDVVLIDQSQKAPRAGSIFAVGVEDVVYLKKLDTEPGKIVLSSFNPDYQPFEIDTRGDLESNVRIIGRVIWSCREW